MVHIFKETRQRNFDHWDILSSTTAKLGKDSNEPDKHVDPHTISKVIAFIVDHNKKANNKYMVNYSLLDDNVTSALNCSLVNTVDNDKNNDDSPIVIDTIIETKEEAIDVDTGIRTTSNTMKKENIQESAGVNILIKGRDKTK